MRLFPQTQVLKNFFNHVGLVNEVDNAELALAFGTNKRVCFINFSDEVGPALFCRRNVAGRHGSPLRLAGLDRKRAGAVPDHPRVSPSTAWPTTWRSPRPNGCTIRASTPEFVFNPKMGETFQGRSASRAIRRLT